MQRYAFTGNRSQRGAAEENPAHEERFRTGSRRERREKNRSPDYADLIKYHYAWNKNSDPATARVFRAE